jgi:hypothetical protein
VWSLPSRTLGDGKTSDLFVTHKDLDTVAVEAMQLPSGEYEGLGAAIMARLLARTGEMPRFVRVA